MIKFYFRIYLTVYPQDGLQISDAELQGLAQQCKRYNDMGKPVFVRYGPEMNGNWFAYGQRPTEFRASWIKVHDAINAVTNLTAMVFSPNVKLFS